MNNRNPAIATGARTIHLFLIVTFLTLS